MNFANKIAVLFSMINRYLFVLCIYWEEKNVVRFLYCVLNSASDFIGGGRFSWFSQKIISLYPLKSYFEGSHPSSCVYGSTISSNVGDKEMACFSWHVYLRLRQRAWWDSQLELGSSYQKILREILAHLGDFQVEFQTEHFQIQNSQRGRELRE